MPRRPPAIVALGAALAVAAAPACSSGSSPSARPPPTLAGPATIQVSSPDVPSGGTIPIRYTCAGDNVPPRLEWGRVPPAAAELAVVLDDPDAPRGTFYHWILGGLPATSTGLDPDARPPGLVEGKGSSGEVGYTGPCPPDGQTHRYRFTVYALRSRVAIDPAAAPEADVGLISAAAVAHGGFVARYGR